MHPGWLSNAYLVADEPGGTAVFVDSGAPVEPLLRRAAEWRVEPSDVRRRVGCEPVRRRLARRPARGDGALPGRRPRRDADRLVARLRREGQGMGALR